MALRESMHPFLGAEPLLDGEAISGTTRIGNSLDLTIAMTITQQLAKAHVKTAQMMYKWGEGKLSTIQGTPKWPRADGPIWEGLSYVFRKCDAHAPMAPTSALRVSHVFLQVRCPRARGPTSVSRALHACGAFGARGPAFAESAKSFPQIGAIRAGQSGIGSSPNGGTHVWNAPWVGTIRY